MVEESKGQHVVYSNRKKPDGSVPLFLNDGNKLEVEEESCCSAHSTLVSDQNTTFTAVKLHGKVMTLKGTKLDTWPSCTEVACWYDSFPFTTVPIPLVHHYDQTKKAFVIYGNVCSVECGLAYMHRESRRHDLWERVVLFEDMMHKVFKQKILGCEPAPPFLTLTRFGGFYSIEEYRASFNVVKMTVIAPPFLMYPLVIQEKHQSSEKRSTSKDAVQDETVLSTGHVLRGLRRPQKASTVTATVTATSFQAVSGPRTVPALESDSSSDTEMAPVHIPVSAALASVGPERAPVPVHVQVRAQVSQQQVSAQVRAQVSQQQVSAQVSQQQVSAQQVPPLSSVQADTELYTQMSRSTKGKGRGRGRSSGSAPAPRSNGPSNNTILSSFLVKK